MKKLLAISLIVLIALACGVPITESSIVTPEPVSAPVQELQLVTVKAWAVNIRYLDGRETGEYAMQGDNLYGYASGEWFILVSMGHAWGKVFLGCVNVDSDYGCQAVK